MKSITLSIVFIAFAFLGILATAKLGVTPPPWLDEGYYSQLAGNLADHGSYGYQIQPGYFIRSPFTTTGYPIILPVAAAIYLFGHSYEVARIPMVIYIFLLVLTALFLIRKIYPRSFLYSVFFIITLGPLYGNGRSVLGEIPGTFFLIAGLLAFSYAIDKNKFLSYFWAGLLFGLTLTAKPTFLPLIPALFITLWIYRRKIAECRFSIIYLLTGLILTYGIGFYFQLGGLPGSDVLTHYATGGLVTDLGALIKKNIFAFFTSVQPLSVLALMSIWLISLVAKIKRKVEIRPEECLAFVFSVILLLFYLKVSPYYRYFFPVQVLCLGFLPSAVFTLSPERFKLAAKILLLVVIFAQATITLRSSWFITHWYDTRAEEIIKVSNYVRPLPDLFVYEVPILPLLLPQKEYYQYISTTPNPNGVLGRENLSLLAKGCFRYVVKHYFEPDNRKQLFTNYRIIRSWPHYQLLIPKMRDSSYCDNIGKRP